ncbi:MAG: hypothetical protein ACI87E_002671 [Mariniblastus sp.]|jgi:hypothetical protein
MKLELSFACCHALGLIEYASLGFKTAAKQRGILASPVEWIGGVDFIGNPTGKRVEYGFSFASRTREVAILDTRLVHSKKSQPLCIGVLKIQDYNVGVTGCPCLDSTNPWSPLNAKSLPISE